MRLTKYGHSCVRIERDGAGPGHRPRVYAHPGMASTLDRLGTASTTHLARLSGKDYAWLEPGTTIN